MKCITQFSPMKQCSYMEKKSNLGCTKWYTIWIKDVLKEEIKQFETIQNIEMLSKTFIPRFS